MAGGAAEAGRSVTSRALAVLDAFDSATPRLSLSEIAARTGLPLTTAHRLLGELAAWGALSRRPDGRYEVGRRLWELGLLAPVQLELRQVAAPFLLDVHTATRDTVHLAVREDLSALYVERISGRESVPVVSQVGSRLPLHATGVGKVLLAWAPDDVAERALRAPARGDEQDQAQPGQRLQTKHLRCQTCAHEQDNAERGEPQCCGTPLARVNAYDPQVAAVTAVVMPAELKLLQVVVKAPLT